VKLGFVAFPRPPEEYVAFAVDNGFAHLEIDLFSPAQWVERFHQARIAALRHQLDSAGLTASFHAAYVLNLADCLPETRAAAVRYVERVLHVAHALGAQWVTVHPGYGVGIPTLSWVRNLALDCLRWSLERLLPIAERLQVRLALENINPAPPGSEIVFLLDSPNEMAQILREFASPMLAVCLDVGHAAVADGFAAYWAVAGDRCVGLHVHDNDGRDDLHQVPGEGVIDWQGIVAVLKRAAFAGAICVELYDDADKIAAKRYLERLIGLVDTRSGSGYPDR
jgi:sugar phosphate isomerase/epimerase